MCTRSGLSLRTAVWVLLVPMLVGSAAQAAELKGTVVEVVGKSVKIRLAGEQLPSVGDKVLIGFSIQESP